jgi:pyruvate dehydrogenase (quinone)
MAQTVADHLLGRLREWGVEQVFGYPGDGINGLLVAFEKAGNQPRFIQARHEEMAAFEAVGYAKFSGLPGVCTATSGPGAIHLLNGLYDAKLDHVPVVAIVGQTERSAMGGAYQQEVDLQALFKDVASDYLVEVNVSEQLPNAIDRAFRTALTRRAPTAVIIPSDLQTEDYTPPAHAFKQVPSSAPGLAFPMVVPDEDDLPFVTGSIGLLGTRPSYELMRDCDTLLIVGSNFPYSQFLPEFGQARAVQIDIDGALIGMRYPTEVNLLGDAQTTLQALLPMLSGPTDRAWREQIEEKVARWWRVVERQSMLDARPVNPMRIVWELSQRIPVDAIVTADSGSVANWYAKCLKMRGRMRGSLSGTLATMGAAVPYAIGAKFAHPDRPAIALVGDGAMQMNNMTELLTIARYADRWSDPRCVVAVLHNNDLTQVTWELRAMGGAPKFEASQTLPDVSYADFARGLDFEAITVTAPDELGPAWDRALAADRPAVLDVHCDPDVPPIPPHATFEQAESLLQAVLKGDPDALHLIAQGTKAKLQEVLPGR